MSFAKDLELRIRASYPCIYIVAREEWRCEQEVKKVAGALEVDYHVWTATKGFDGAKSPVDPDEAIKSIIEKEGVFSFINFHHYLEVPEMQQIVKDLVQVGKGIGQTVIFISNVWKVPEELQDDLSKMEFALPGHELLGERVDYLLSDEDIKTKVPGLTNGERDAVIEAALGMTTWEAENAMSLSLCKEGRLDPKLVAQEKARAVAKSGILEFYESGVSMSDVGGLGNLKGWLKQRRRAFTKEAREYGLPDLKGILLVGVPGCGKSLTAKAVAADWGLPLIRFDLGRLFQGLVGASEENVRRAIAVAESVAPVVLWIDEIEKGMAGVGGSGSTDSGVTARVFGTLVSWMQDRKRPVFVVATANQIQNLPPELMRAGRWDEMFAVDLPSVEEREEILRIHLVKRGRDPDKFNLSYVAKEFASQFSGAELEAAVVKAMFRAFSEEREVDSNDLMWALDLAETVPLAVTRREEIEALRQWATTRAKRASDREPPKIMEESEVGEQRRKLRLKMTTYVESVEGNPGEELSEGPREEREP